MFTYGVSRDSVGNTAAVLPCSPMDSVLRCLFSSVDDLSQLMSFFFFQAEDGIRDYKVTGVQTCALPICPDDERAAELNHYLRSDDNDAIFFARGGYGLMRILDGLDFDALRANPRPVVDRKSVV